MARGTTPISRQSNDRVRLRGDTNRNKSSIDDSNLEDHNKDEDNDMPNAKRRKSSRAHTSVDYSLQRKYSKVTEKNNDPESKSSESSRDRNHQLIIDGVTYTEDAEALKIYLNKELTKVERLGKLSMQHSLLTQELYHLEQFTSLVTWDPDATPSKSYQEFVNDNYDLWKDPKNEEGNDSLENARSRRKSRHSLRGTTPVDPLKSVVEEAKEDFVDEIANPSKFYYDHFLKLKSDGRKMKKIPIQRFNTPERSFSSKTANKSQTSDSPASKSRGRPPKSKVKEEENTDETSDSLPATPAKRRGRPPKAKGQNIEKDSNDEDEEKEDRDSGYESESPQPYIKDGPVPKLRFRIKSRRSLITHPDHLATPEYDSLEDYLNSFKSLEEDITNEEYEDFIKEQTEIKDNIKSAIAKNILTVDDQANIHKVPPPLAFRDPLKANHTHGDHLVGQAVFLSKLFADSKKVRISRARKISQMVEAHFKRQAGAEDRARKEEERRLKALARNAVQSVKKRWILAERAYRILKNQEQEELKRIKGKEHLSQMLEHSTQLLGAQLTKQSDSEAEEDEDMLLEAKIAEEDDSSLTVEQLQEKYAHLRDLKLDEISEQDQEKSSEEIDEVEEDDEEEIADHEDVEDEKIEVPELTEKEKEAVEEENANHDSLLDSDSSLDSDDDSDLSSEEDEEMTDEESSKPSGLAALFGKQQESDDDDESVASYAGSGDDNNDERIDEVSENDSDTEPQKEHSTPDSTPAPDSEQKTITGSKASSVEPSDGVVDVPNPSLLLRGNLRYYQKQGLNWLASLYNNHTNGILADEMGLGKTIQTISLISYLAVSKGNWGPHLIIVPTSVLLNWEMEFKRFAPGFKLMVYYGSPQQRKEKRKGWNKPDTFHVCITSYQLVCQDQQVFKRKRWKYMILDEAHNIKNFKSNRWNALLNFNTENRLLLTGTPLQNNIMELWSLLYFLMPSSKANQAMPSGFANLDDFQQWFGKPVDKIIEGGMNQEVDEETKQTVSKLHQVLRPYLLRRLKADVESQMPGKYEHIVYCRLSKRQYKLYHEYLARSDTKEMLKNANYISIINALMQLRKVCNHPDLFEERPITTSFAVPTSVITPYQVSNNVVLKLLSNKNRDRNINLDVLNLDFGSFEKEGLITHHSTTIKNLKSSTLLKSQVQSLTEELSDELMPNYSDIAEFYKFSTYNRKLQLLQRLNQLIYINNLRCDKTPVYGSNLIKLLTVVKPINLGVSFEEELIKPLETRIFSLNDIIDRYSFVTPAVVTLNMPQLSVSNDLAVELTSDNNGLLNPYHKLQTKLSIQFPDKSLLLYDCGKLQKLAKLLQQLKDGGHRALIFTQMTKVLDILEQFLNIMGIRYMRLDGATKIEDRQILTERFNKDNRIMVFILSTRSGGLGINLTGADTVIFYDSDWNPAMDKQCQDRCHRIGQTRDVHIYRFVSEYTIESNILKKANQKRHLDNVIIQEGEFTTDYFSKLSVKDLLGGGASNDLDLDESKPLFADTSKIGNALAQAEDAADAQAAKEAMKEVELDNEDFVDDKNGEDGEKGEFSDDDNVGHIDEYMIKYIANGYYYD